MISGIQKLSIYDPATGTTIQLNNISSNSTFKIKDVLTEEDGTGGTVYAGDDSEAKIVSFDTAGFSQLETWMSDGTLINFVAYGLEDNILWYENTPIDAVMNFAAQSGKRNSMEITIAKKGGEHQIFSLQNMMNYADPNAVNVTIVFPIADAVLRFNNIANVDITNFATTSLLTSAVDATLTLPSNTYYLKITKPTAGTDTFVGEVAKTYTGITW